MPFPPIPSVIVPRWAYSGGVFTQPPIGQRETGWQKVSGQNYGPIAPYQYENWINYAAGEWLQYASEALAYLNSAGVSAWDATVSYSQGSIVTDGIGMNLYVSLQNTNLNNAVSNAAFWGAPRQGGLPSLTMTQTILTTSGTYTPSSPFVKYIEVEILGGGGAGGSSTTSGTAPNAGGGSGAYSKGFFPRATFGASVPYTIGGGGIGVPNNNSRQSGGGSSFGTLISFVGGGEGGLSENYGLGGTAATSTPPVGGYLMNLYGNYSGQPSISKWTSPTDITSIGGYGASSIYGAGAVGQIITLANQGAAGATGYGAGGGGGSGQGKGGNGSPGLIILKEYIGLY